MLPASQPARPQIPAVRQINPQYQQQTRTANTATTDRNPRNQIEAMPPNKTPNPVSTQQPFNPANMHPVFFSNSWRKQPFPMPGTAAFSPVATGYVFGNTKQPPNNTKL